MQGAKCATLPVHQTAAGTPLTKLFPSPGCLFTVMSLLQDIPGMGRFVQATVTSLSAKVRASSLPRDPPVLADC